MRHCALVASAQMTPGTATSILRQKKGVCDQGGHLLPPFLLGSLEDVLQGAGSNTLLLAAFTLSAQSAKTKYAKKKKETGSFAANSAILQVIFCSVGIQGKSALNLKLAKQS